MMNQTTQKPYTRLSALLLALVLLISVALLPIGAMLAAVADTDPDLPEVRIVATLVDGGQYVEVGMTIHCSESGSFQSAGVLLSYDPSVLTPVAWDNSPIETPNVTNAATAGDEAAILPSKVADILAGKRADVVTVNGTQGYLFLSAEAARPIIGLQQALPEEKYVPETPETPDPPDTPDPDEPEGLSAELPSETATGHRAISYIKKAESPAEYATVVRFKVTAEADHTALVNALDMVVQTVDEDGAVTNEDLFYSFPLAGNDALTYIKDNTTYPDAGVDSAAKLSFVWILDGVTVNTSGGGVGGMSVNLAGGTIAAENADDYAAFVEACHALTPGASIAIPAFEPKREMFAFGGWTLGETDEDGKLILYRYDAEAAPAVSVTMGNGPTALAAVWNSTTEGVIAVTAFDWDGTMLGTFVYRADADPAVQQANADAAIAEFVALPDVAPKLVSHAGYDFLAWVKNRSDVPSSYGKRVRSDANAELDIDLLVQEADKPDFATLTQSTTVKAGYTTNDSIITGMDQSGVAAQTAVRHYQTQIVGYNRFGVSQNFSITIRVKRGNVPRATMGYLLVRSEISGVSVYSRYALTGADEEEIEVALYAATQASGDLTGVALVEWTVIDAYGYSSWVNAGARTDVTQCRSRASFTIRNVGTSKNQQVWDEGTYPLEGIVASVYQQLIEKDEADVALSLNAAQLRTVGVPPSSTNNNTLKTRVYNNWVALGKPKLTYELLYQIGSQASIS